MVIQLFCSLSEHGVKHTKIHSTTKTHQIPKVIDQETKEIQLKGVLIVKQGRREKEEEEKRGNSRQA